MINVKQAVYDEIVAAAIAAAPIEACGYLAGRDEEAVESIEMTNVDQSPEHFSFDPAEQFAAVKAARASGHRLLAVWHSHPASLPRMSEEDKRLACDPRTIYVIYSIMTESVKAFRREGAEFVDERIEIVP